MNDPVRLEVERYLAGDMPASEAASFLESIREDREALAYLGRALEDQAHLFDAIREASPARPARIRARLGRTSEASPNVLWAAGLAAAALFVLLIFGSTERSRSPRPPAPPRDVAELPAPPAPEPRSVPESKGPRATPRPPDPEPPFVVPPRVVPPAPPEAPPPPPPVPKPEPPAAPDPVKPTRVTIATIERVQGEGFLLSGADRAPARPGALLAGSDGLLSGGLIVVKFPDATRLELGHGTLLREVSQGSAGKRIRQESGQVTADVSKQAAPFVLATPEADVVVLGTKFTVACASGSTKIDVREGRVKVTRPSDGASTEVPAEHGVLVTATGPVEAKPFPIDDLLLVPSQGRITGGDWRLVNDAETRTGAALEALKSRSGALQDAPCVTFTAAAEAGKTYHVWVRGKCLAKSSRVEHDAVILEFADSTVVEPPGPNAGLTGSPERGLFNGFMHASGYGWVGSDSDRGRDVAPVTVRFNRTGRQTIRLYAWESPVRIDAIWLSAGQKSRPDDAQTGPAAPAKK